MDRTPHDAPDETALRTIIGSFTLRGLHTALRECVNREDDAEMDVVFDCGGSPRHFTSYRGYYTDLALVSGLIGDDDQTETVKLGSLLARCESVVANRTVFYDYRGGEYTMNWNTQIWQAIDDSETGRKIVGVSLAEGKVVLVTEQYDIAEHIGGQLSRLRANRRDCVSA